MEWLLLLVTLQMMVLYLDGLAEDRIAWRPKARQAIMGLVLRETEWRSVSANVLHA